MDKLLNCVDFNAFKTETGLDDDQVRELYEGFLEELLEEKKKLVEQLKEKDYGRLARTIHNIKGISGSYMLTAVFKIASSLNSDIKSDRFEGIASGVAELTAEIDKAETEITSHFGF